MTEPPKAKPQVDSQVFAVKLPKYRRLKKYFRILGSSVALAPLFILTAFYYHLDQTSLRSEVRHNVSEIMSNTKRTLEFIVEERVSSLKLIVHEETYNSLDSDEGLALILKNLRQSFGGYLDLGLVDSKGIQNRYVGPYELKGQDYADQSWFHEVSVRGIYISDIFLGHRRFPHFIIAVKKEMRNGDFYVIRSSIDLEMLDNQIHAKEFKLISDAFLVNKDGILQTESIEFGDVFSNYPIDIPKSNDSGEIIVEKDENGEILVTGYAYIAKTPFILIVTNHRTNHLENWLAQRTDLLWFLGISIILIVGSILFSSSYMFNIIKDADAKRTKLLHNIEYTNKMATIGRMAASVAHEINNPLAIINEKAGLVKDIVSYDEGFPKREKILGAIISIINSVERGSKVTHRLLGFGRRLDTHHELIDLDGLLREVIGFVSKEAEHRNVTINLNIDEKVRPIESDRGQLQQVFLNLVNNAIGAMNDGGRVDVDVAIAADNQICISITDNGIGIAQEDLKHIFEPFFSTKGEFGTGLGLSITYEIIEKLGGNIVVESEVDIGTRFVVLLPK